MIVRPSGVELGLLLEYGETLKFVYIKYQPILVKSYQRFTKFNYGVTRTNYEI